MATDVPPDPPSAPRRFVPRRLVFGGEAIVDVTMSVPALPVPGADVLAESSRIRAGGGFNVMAAAARQGMPVLYAGGHGTGPWGDLVRKALAEEGIIVLRGPDPNQDTGFVIALNQQAGGRVYVTQLGSESARPPGSLDQIPVTENDSVYISGYGLLGPDSGPVLAKWTENLPPRALLFLDPGPLVAKIPAPLLDQVLRRCTWLSLNATEAAALTGTQPPEEACRTLQTRLLTGNVIVRSGSEGCHLATASTQSVIHIPAPKVNAVDTTGAGDTHAGVFLAALSDGLPAVDAAERANQAAAMSVTRPGPATAPTRAELDAARQRKDEQAPRQRPLVRPYSQSIRSTGPYNRCDVFVLGSGRDRSGRPSLGPVVADRPGRGAGWRLAQPTGVRHRAGHPVRRPPPWCSPFSPGSRGCTPPS